MLNVHEVEAAVDAMPSEQQQHVLNHLMTRLHPNVAAQVSSGNPDVRNHILDVPPVFLGGLKTPFRFSREELYDDMLEDRL